MTKLKIITGLKCLKKKSGICTRYNFPKCSTGKVRKLFKFKPYQDTNICVKECENVEGLVNP
jgi:hypothetical protein